MNVTPNILFFADTTHQAGAVRDHIHAVTASDDFHWHVVNPLSLKTIDKLDLSLFDAIGIHFSIKMHGYYYLSGAIKRKIKAFKGFKFVFLQDEYQKVNHTQDLLAKLGCDVLFTLVRPECFQQAYPDKRLKNLKKVHVLTGYVDDALLSLDPPPISQRTIDVSYRSRRCDYRLGKLGQEKTILATEFPKYAKGHDLTLDISVEESDRVYGEAWFNLLKNSKVVLGTESGASIWDVDGRIGKKTRQFLRKHHHATFDTVFKEVLEPYEGNLHYSAISPRVFEAASAKAAMVMFVGDYSHVCKPDVHYIPLQKDFSNIGEVLEKIKDDTFLQSLADRAYEDLIASGSYAKERLSAATAKELTEAFKTQKLKASDPLQVKANIAKLSVRYKLLNQFRCFYTELAFVFFQFSRLLFLEPSETWVSKLGMLTEGAKRYLSYMNPRVKG